MATDLERAWAALSGKQTAYDNLWGYYQGEQPVVYTNQRLREIFRDLDAVFTENWCSVVVNSVLERLELQRLMVEDEGVQDTLDQIWAENELDLESDEAHLGALVTGEAFLLAWREEGKPVEAYYNDPRLCHMFYDPEHPRMKTFAAKWWVDDDEKRRMTLYYPDRLEYYVSKQKASNVQSAKGMEPAEEPVAANPFNEIPVFHFRTGRRAASELQDVVPLQNGINKLLIDMMVAAEYGAFKQRWIISNTQVDGKLKNAPNEIWDLPAGDGVGQQTQVGQFEATDLSVYLAAIDNLAAAIGIISRTPKHYFYSQGGDPSGEALIALEAPLNKKCTRHIARFTPTWQRAAAFLLKLADKQVERTAITPVFEEPETVQPLTRAQVRQFEVTSGIPLTTAVRREGWTQAEIDQMAEDRAAESEWTSNIGDQMLTAFERGQEE